MTAAELRSEIQSDPAGIGYAAALAARNDAALAGLLNDASKGSAMPKPVPIGQFALTMAAIGLRSKLEAGAVTTDPPAGLCKTLLELITLSPHIALFDPANGLPLLTSLKDAGVLTTQDVAIVTAYVTQPAARAENLWGVGVTVGTDSISNALAGA